jgi:hypothetical protein
MRGELSLPARATAAEEREAPGSRWGLSAHWATCLADAAAPNRTGPWTCALLRKSAVPPHHQARGAVQAVKEGERLIFHLRRRLYARHDRQRSSTTTRRVAWSWTTPGTSTGEVAYNEVTGTPSMIIAQNGIQASRAGRGNVHHNKVSISGTPRCGVRAP